MEKPKNVGEVRAFLGMTNYVSRFIYDYSTMSEPLRRLTKIDKEFVWGQDQNASFNQLKDALLSDRVMTYFCPQKDPEL